MDTTASLTFEGPISWDVASEREWILTNGLGGYASSTVCGMNTRRYHGLLVAALQPPGNRTLLVAKLEEEVTIGKSLYLLSTNQYPDTIYPRGYFLLKRFTLEKNAVTTLFVAGSAQLEKRITLIYGENTTLVSYRNVGDTPYELALIPLVNGRDFHGETSVACIDFAVNIQKRNDHPRVNIRPHWMQDPFWISADKGNWEEYYTWYRNMTYQWEIRRGLPAHDNHLSPGRITVMLAPGEMINVRLGTTQPLPKNAIEPLDAPRYSIPERAPAEVKMLYDAADSFLVKRGKSGRTVIAGYHWFGDWGRDTMIALPGLCITTGRYAEAAEILRTFAAARRNGLLPNLFTEDGGECYNTVDAALWYFFALDKYMRATGDRTLLQELKPALEEIINSYRAGTDYGIYMDSDSLIVAGSTGWQLTWMDAKVGEKVITPRYGKPVEINALWYNALCCMAEWAKEENWEGNYAELATRVKDSFAKFWYADGDFLYDVVGTPSDAKLRPNQIFAVSLPYSPLNEECARAVLKVVERDLLTPHGLRTLSPHDPEYRGNYGGNSGQRDSAYHQGTVWAWLIGHYLDAYLRVNGNTPEAKCAARTMLQPLLAHVREAGLGTISEIFTGDAPHSPCGAISQAWSVAEVLRAWVESGGLTEECKDSGDQLVLVE